MVATTHDMVTTTRDIQGLTNDLRVHISDFEDFLRPIRSYFYWEKHCYDIPVCFALRSVFDSLDGVDAVTDKLGDVVTDLNQIDVLLPQIVAQFPEMIAIMESSASSELYALLKREDEKAVTERAYENPVFVEDLVRNVALKLNAHPDVTWYKVEAENQESIHNHNAYACIEKG